MSSDYDYISEHMGGWNDDTGLPNFMDEPGFSDDSYDYDDEEDEDNSNNIELGFDIGDTVTLNSSDVLMTIKNIDDDILTCRWFDKNNTLQSSTFNILEIDIVKKTQQQQSYQQSVQQQYQQPVQQQSSYNDIPEIDINEDEIPF